MRKSSSQCFNIKELQVWRVLNHVFESVTFRECWTRQLFLQQINIFDSGLPPSVNLTTWVCTQKGCILDCQNGNSLGININTDINQEIRLHVVYCMSVQLDWLLVETEKKGLKCRYLQMKESRVRGRRAWEDRQRATKSQRGETRKWQKEKREVEKNRVRKMIRERNRHRSWWREVKTESPITDYLPQFQLDVALCSYQVQDSWWDIFSYWLFNVVINLQW